jgi:hypothetical protein
MKPNPNTEPEVDMSLYSRAPRLTETEVILDFGARGFSFVPTTDDWYPTFPDGTVAVSGVIEYSERYRLDHPDWPYFKILVTGDDDTGMEKEFYTPEEAEATLSALPAVIAKQDLLDRGFHSS